MIIAIGYEETYTADPSLWDLFINMCSLKGHQVILVSSRIISEKVVKEMQHPMATSYCTNGLSKRDFLRRQGITPDVWIESRPHLIFENIT